MLGPIRQIEPLEPAYGTDSPTVTCDNPACGKSGPSHLMTNFMIAVGSPGHPALSGFQCPGNYEGGRPEHWACSLECWRLIAHACIDEHMHSQLQVLHSELTGNGGTNL